MMTFKKCIPLCIVIITIAGIGCKKYTAPEEVPVSTKKWVVTTIAGGDSASFVNGPAPLARFHFPLDVAVAADGAIFVTDVQNHCIRKIAGSQVTTFAGTNLGIVNGHGLSAEFRHPFGIAIGGNENIYTTDVDDSRIRKITPAADVTTYAGTDEDGAVDGDADTAQFRDEAQIATDALGNVYIADPQNNRIRKISTAGKVSTIAGSDTAGFRNGNGSNARFDFPSGIAVDKDGNVYVSDAGNSRIRKISPDGEVTSFAGNGISDNKDGDASTASFYYPTDLAIDGAGNLFVIDLDRIRKITPQGAVSTIAGSTSGYVDGDATLAKFNSPAGIGIDAQGNISVAAPAPTRIRPISLQ